MGSPLWIVSTLGSPGQRVGNILANSAAWSNDQKRIAYSQYTDLSVANSDGSQPRRLFSGSGVIEYVPMAELGAKFLFQVIAERAENSRRQFPTDHDYAVPTREYQTDQSSLKPAQAAARSVLGKKQKQRQLQKQLHRSRGVDTVTPYQANALIDLPRSIRVFGKLPRNRHHG